MTTMHFTVIFQPLGRTITVAAGTLISEAAVMAGISDLHLPCGGRGSCGKCLVEIVTGGDNGTRARVGACTTRIRADTEVWIERQERLGASCIVADASIETTLPEGFELSPLCRKIFVRTPAPGIHDNYADFELLEREIGKQCGAAPSRCSRGLLQSLAATMRERNGEVTAAVVDAAGRRDIIALDPGDTRASGYGIACDIGTTTISLRLVELSTGRIAATESDYNAQISRGADVISRIEYGGTPEKREEMRLLVLGAINKLVAAVLGHVSAGARSVLCISISGNSAMLHLFLGLPARYLREHPYVPTVKWVPALSAADCGIDIHPAAPVFCAPGVGSYVGGDITAGLLCTALVCPGADLTLFIDIGTNGEIVVGDGEFLITTACSAGPAFEGSGIACGMRAAPGAIDSFRIEHGGESIDWSVIGGGKPSGICGSGFISLLGELLKAGAIDAAGKFTDNTPAERRVTAGGTDGLVLVPAPCTATGKDIVITEADIDNLIRTKAAIYSACDRLLSGAGLDFTDVAKFLIAGGFGRFIDIEDAIRIGLFPDIERSRFAYLGNTSLAGATRALLCARCRDELAKLPARMTYVELSNDPRYMDAYVAALFLPHTEAKRFPGVRANG